MNKKSMKIVLAIFAISFLLAGCFQTNDKVQVKPGHEVGCGEGVYILGVLESFGNTSGYAMGNQNYFQFIGPGQPCDGKWINQETVNINFDKVP